MTWRSSQDFARETGAFERFIRGMVRRVAVSITAGTRWQVIGQRGGMGGDETLEVEPFTGVGFYARPPRTGKPEAVAVAIGGAKTMAVVATRDEATRQLVAAELAEGETCVYNDKAVLVVKADGAVEIRLVNGAAIQLALKLDLEILRAALSAAAIVPGAAGAAAVVTACDTAARLAVATLTPPRAPRTPAWPIGTSQLLAQ